MHQASAASVPVIHVCGRLVIGFDQAETTGKRIEDLLTTWSRPCPGEADSTQWKRRPVFQLVRLQNSSQGLARPPPPADEPFQLPLPPLPVGAVPDRPTAEEASVAKSETTGATGIELPWLG